MPPSLTVTGSMLPEPLPASKVIVQSASDAPAPTETSASGLTKWFLSSA